MDVTISHPVLHSWPSLFVGRLEALKLLSRSRRLFFQASFVSHVLDAIDRHGQVQMGRSDRAIPAEALAACSAAAARPARELCLMMALALPLSQKPA